jgi:hypothetical protein
VEKYKRKWEGREINLTNIAVLLPHRGITGIDQLNDIGMTSEHHQHLELVDSLSQLETRGRSGELKKTKSSEMEKRTCSLV